MDDIKINPEFIGLFYNDLLDIEKNHKKKELNKNKIINEYKKIKISEEEIKILKEIINLICDKNK
jgi:hypothetical protein